MEPLLIVRGERESDHPAVHALNARAFETDLEARLVDAVRGTAEPIVSLVAEREGDGVVGHILFTPVEVAENPDGLLVLGLGPMAVAPERQRQGVGGVLVRRGLDACGQAGAAAVVVLGHADYYPRFGFAAAARWGLTYKGEELAPYFMALELDDGALDGLSGEVVYLPPFEAAGESG